MSVCRKMTPRFSSFAQKCADADQPREQQTDGAADQRADNVRERSLAEAIFEKDDDAGDGCAERNVDQRRAAQGTQRMAAIRDQRDERDATDQPPLHEKVIVVGPAKPRPLSSLR